MLCIIYLLKYNSYVYSIMSSSKERANAIRESRYPKDSNTRFSNPMYERSGASLKFNPIPPLRLRATTSEKGLSLDNLSTSIFNKVRWSRVFVSIGNNGVSSSYFLPVLIIGGAIYFFMRYRRKKKEGATKK